MGPTLRAWLTHPLTRGLDVNDPRTVHLRRRIIGEKKFLREIYEEWYARIAASLPEGEGEVVEIGSGAGFLRERLPGLITSDVLEYPGVDMTFDAAEMPFADGQLRAVVMTNVLHHLPDVRRFFREASRCVREGGRVSMIEPWVTPWSSFVYTRLHHEPFDAKAAGWTFPAAGPLSGANGALPWLLFERDREQFAREFPEWRVRSVELLMPFRYVASGGFATRDLMPGWTYGLWRGLDRLFSPWLKTWATMAHITLDKEAPARGRGERTNAEGEKANLARRKTEGVEVSASGGGTVARRARETE